MTDAEFRAWLARDNEQRCVLVELDYIKESTDSPSEPVLDTLYLSDKKFFDFVTNHPYVDVVRATPQYSRSLSGDRLGTYTSTVGSLELDNADGALDFLLTLAIDGSQVRFKYGSPDWPEADFKLIFSAILSKASAPAFDRISVTLKDTGLLLDKSIGGTSTVGGTGPNADRSRSLNFGYIHNMSPLVIDETIGGGKYEHSDTGTDTAAVEVRDRGVSVAFTDNGDGTFTLTAPPDGAVTCDVLAEPLGSDKVRISDAMDYLIGDRAGLTALSLYAGNGPTFTRDDDDDYKVGVELAEARNIIDLLSDLCESGNCFPAVKRTGEFTFGRLRLNDIADLIADSPPAIEAVDISADDVDKGTFRIEHALPLYYKFQAYMSRNWNKQTDFASSLSPDEQAVYSRPGLYLLQPDSVGTDYLSAPELYHKTLKISPVIDTLLSEAFSAFDLDSLAQWMTTKRAAELPWIEMPSFATGIDFYQLELGDPVRLTIHDADEKVRYSFEAVLFQAIGIVIRLTDAKIDLRLARRTVIEPVPDRWLRVESAMDDAQQEYVASPPFVQPLDPSLIGNAGSPIGFRRGGGMSVGMSFIRPRPTLDYIHWLQFGAAGTNVTPLPKTGATDLGLSFTVTANNLLQRRTEGTDWTSNYSNGDHLVLAYVDNLTFPSLEINFSSPVKGVTTQIVSDWYTTFDGFITAYDSSHTLLESNNHAGLSGGSNSFSLILSILRSTADISYIKFEIRNADAGSAFNQDFLVNTIIITR